MSLLGLKTFRHGVHPPESKDDTKGMAIRQFPFAPLLVVPLVQHAGKPSVAVVREGQEVARGQCIARPDGYLSVAMHAPASGIVRRIALAPGISGRMVPAIYLEPFPGSTQEIADGKPCPLDAPVEEILTAIQDAGVVGLGGAAFPTHVKLKVPEGKAIDTLIINGAECEPFLTTDHRVMLEQRDDIFTGIRYLLRVTGASRVIVGVESNKADAAEHLRGGVPPDLPVEIEVLGVKYPQGAEKMLITALLGREVPSGGLPSAVGALVHQRRDDGRDRPSAAARPGHPGAGHHGHRPGGGEEGQLPHSDRHAAAFRARDRRRRSRRAPRLPRRADDGPGRIEPRYRDHQGDVGSRRLRRAGSPSRPTRRSTRASAAATASRPARCSSIRRRSACWRRTASTTGWPSEQHLMDCFECGSCSFVCPAHIPLVQQFRMAKAMVRKRGTA